jgi:hypothetical protein
LAKKLAIICLKLGVLRSATTCRTLKHAFRLGKMTKPILTKPDVKRLMKMKEKRYE